MQLSYSDFVTQDKPIFVRNIQNICGHKSGTMGCMRLIIGMDDKHHMYRYKASFIKIWEVTLQFFIDFGMEYRMISRNVVMVLLARFKAIQGVYVTEF